MTPNDVSELTARFIQEGPTTTPPLSSPGVTEAAGKTARLESARGRGHETAPALLSAPSLLPNSSQSSWRLSSRPCPHKYLILLCSQKSRDARCGQTAPLLRRELERQLRPLGLYRDLSDERPGGVGIYFISHVGGHKYSANMLIYRKSDDLTEAQQAIWLARVRPEDCEGIVRFTVLQGKVVKPETQLRGGFDRERGLVSW